MPGPVPLRGGRLAGHPVRGRQDRPGRPRFSRAEAVHRDEPRLRPHRGLEGSILDLDPPDHTRLRRIVAKAFTARHIEALRPRTEQIAAELADGMVARGAPADLVADFALPLPVTVICELLGVPLADRADFRTWSDALLSTTKYTPREVQDCTDALMAYMAGLIAERRAAPHDDLLGTLVDARDNDERLSERELQVLAISLLVAGHETTASQIPNFVYTLLTHPGQLAALRADPGLVPGAVEELMRYVPLGNGAGMPATRWTTSNSAAAPYAPGRRWSSAPSLPTATKRCTPTPTGSTCCARRPPTSGSGTDRTTAWAPNWPAWNCRWPCAPCSTGCPDCASPDPTRASCGSPESPCAGPNGCRSSGTGPDDTGGHAS